MATGHINASSDDSANKIELPEPTFEALEEFLADPMVSLFINDEAKEIIREKLKDQLVTREEYNKRKKE